MIAQLVSGAIQGLAGIGGMAVKAKNAKQNQKDAELLKAQGQALQDSAIKNKKAYQIAPEIQQQYDRSVSDLSAKSAVQSAMETQADAGVSNLVGAISRNSTSGAGAIAAAQAAEAQRQAGYQGAAVAGAQERGAKLDRLERATGAIAQQRDTAYDINEQQKFERDYGRAQDMIGSGYQGAIDARAQRANAWTEGLSAIGNIAGAVGGGGFGGLGGGSVDIPMTSYNSGKKGTTGTITSNRMGVGGNTIGRNYDQKYDQGWGSDRQIFSGAAAPATGTFGRRD